MRADANHFLLRFGCLLILFALSAGCASAGLHPAVTWWIANPLTKIKPNDPIPDSLDKRAILYAARNEFEPFQLVLRGGDADLPDVDIDVSDFEGNGVPAISKNNITVYFEQFIDVTRPSSIEGGTGLWPDPLIPRVDRYANEKRNAFPFALRRGRNQPLWIEIFVPAATLRGEYSGHVRVSSNGVYRFSVPVTLTVWRFVLPSTSTLRSSFGLNGTTLLKQHKGRYTSDEDLYALTRLYTKAALLHHISIHGGSEVPPKYRYAGGHMEIEWSRYDAEVAPFLNGTALTENEPLHGARATSVELRTPAFDNDDEQIAWWKQWAAHFEQSGWRDRLFLYLWDEPAPQDLPGVLRRGRAALRADPAIRTLLTLPFTGSLHDVVRIWTPLVNCLETRPGFDPYCAQAPPLDVALRDMAAGDSMWFYQSCASHGCNITGGPYFAGWPSYMIDMQGAANRVMQWVAWKYRMEGELYYSMNEAYAHEADPWTSVFLFGGNGDGTLFYPGRPDRIGGRTDIPIESIRLKLIREGMEDHEYLTLLASLGGRAAAEVWADRIVRKPWEWESRAVPFLNVRRELGETLDRMTAAQPSVTSDAR